MVDSKATEVQWPCNLHAMHRFQQVISWVKLKLKAIIYWTLGIIAATVATIVVERALDNGESRFVTASYIAVVMSTRDPTFTIPEEFLAGFGSPTYVDTRNGTKIDFRYMDDGYSTIQAEQIAKKLVADPKCILIIGNANSQLTEITLHAVVASGDPPSMLLPIATASSLTSIAKSADYRSMLRMVPDNEDQAGQISSFIATHSNNPNVAILVDEDNRTYSDDLSNRLAAKLRKAGSNIVYKKLYGNGNRLINDLSNLRTESSSPDFIIFVGISNNGLLLIDELKALSLRVPVIFTDGCTVEELMRKTSELTAPAYFLSAVTINNQTLTPTYRPIGADTFRLARQIVGGITTDSREELRAYIEGNKGTFQLENGAAGRYRFDQDGNNSIMSFKLYRMVGDKVIQVHRHSTS